MSTVKMQVGSPLPYYMNINIKYNVSLLYTPASVNSVLNVTSYLSGYTMGMQWTQIDWVSNRFARPNGGYGATGSVDGLYTFNLIIKDIPVSGSEPLTYGFIIN
ncbi:MAG: hypothetical protein SCL54_07660 [Bacillota bacterium]|nr:hypothetical protein [Bacillota bacterium]